MLEIKNLRACIIFRLVEINFISDKVLILTADLFRI